MGHQILCLSLIVMISIPQVTPLFFDLLGLGDDEGKDSLEINEDDLESLQLQRLNQIQQLQQLLHLRELQAQRLNAGNRYPLGNSGFPKNIPLLPIEPIPLSQLIQLGIGGLSNVGQLGGYGRSRYLLLNENRLDRESETEEPASKGILGGIRDTIGALMGFRRSEDDEEEELVLPTGPRMEHHIHTYDIVPPPLLPRNGPELPFGVQALNPFIRNFGQPNAAPFPGGAYRNYY